MPLLLDSLPAGAHIRAMKQRLPCLLLAAQLALSAAGAAKGTASAPVKTQARVSIELQDGSRIIGQLKSETLLLKSALLGELRFPVENIRSMQWSPKTGAARLKASNGDELEVQLVASELRVKTGYGEVKLPAASLRQMQVSLFGGPVDLRRGLLALWSAEDNGLDSVEGHTGTLMYGAGFGEGKVGQAFRFQTDQGRVYVPDKEDFVVNGSFSAAGWVKVDEFGWGCICARGDERQAWDTWSIAALVGNRINFGVGTDEGGEAHVEAPARPGEWFHLACVYDQEAGSLAVYIDGQLGGEKPTSVKLVWRLDSSLDPSVGLGNVSGKFHRFPFRGSIDEWAIYGRALSQAEVRALVDLGNAGKRVLPPPSK
jgi:hypothetical protein